MPNPPSSPAVPAAPPYGGAPYAGPPPQTPAGYAYVPTAPGYGLGQEAGYGEPPGRSSGGWHLFLGITTVVVGLALVAGLLFYLAPHLKGDSQAVTSDPAEVEVTLPTHLHGWTKMEGRRETQLIAQITAKVPSQMHPRGAVYGRGGVYQAIVIIEPHRLNGFQQAAMLAQDVKAAKPHHLTMRAVPAGPLGGHMQCGLSPDASETDCDFADDGAYGYIALLGQPKNYQATVLAIRAAVEHRLG